MSSKKMFTVFFFLTSITCLYMWFQTHWQNAWNQLELIQLGPCWMNFIFWCHHSNTMQGCNQWASENCCTSRKFTSTSWGYYELSKKKCSQFFHTSITCLYMWFQTHWQNAWNQLELIQLGPCWMNFIFWCHHSNVMQGSNQSMSIWELLHLPEIYQHQKVLVNFWEVRQLLEYLRSIHF